MQKTYLIDGYNVIHASPVFRRLFNNTGHEAARAALVNAVATFAERNNSRCTIIFDGAAEAGQVTPNVNVVASNGRSADDLIRDAARREGRRLAVVSSDMEIVATARANMAEIVHAKAFVAQLTVGTHTQPASAPGAAARPHRIAELRERSEKPGAISRDDLDEWKRLFEGE
ncbi:MAG: NYN domain-containing protein [Bacteroidetes bacterium]|nr:NYN domain-containing protein [Bacteroidota bacterium]